MRTIRTWAFALLAGLFFVAPGTSQAMPPHTIDRGFREGANHHLGDDSFVARFGRRPTSADAEALRMRTHFEYVRHRIASAPATRPELAPMRARILAALDAYIAKGTTPENDHLPWRNPVFIDDDGTICAVGYLIEQTAGRALSERIAASHRYDMIEDIAVAMPEVAAWVAASGLTLDEIASIQPGYVAPIVETWHPWNLAKAQVPDGAFLRQDPEGELRGTVHGGRMDGTCFRRDARGEIVGAGEMKAGTGTWTSHYPDGMRMAVGPLERNEPEGEWRLYHPSGNLAAEGRFHRGVREGHWQFFQDATVRVPIADGAFRAGRVAGEWRHFDASGALIATSSGTSLDIVPGPDHMHHSIDQGNLDGDHYRLDTLRTKEETLYLRYDTDDVYDATGHKLVQTDGVWSASACDWTASERRAGRAGTMSGIDLGRASARAAEECVDPKAIEPLRAARITAMLASVLAVRSVSPEFVRKLALGQSLEGVAPDEGSNDLTKVLARNMTWYVEWPHIDGRFIALFRTLPGYATET